MSISYNLSYSSRDDNTHNTLLDLNVSFETDDRSVVIANLNTWLTAIGSDLEVSEIRI